MGSLPTSTKSRLENMSPFSCRLLKHERCICGHTLHSHKCDIPKTMRSKIVKGSCTKCDCKEIVIR